MGEIIQGDCLDVMAGMDAGSVDLIYADPPYYTQKDWGEFDDRWESFDVYLAFMEKRLRECHRVLAETGSLYLHVDPNTSHYFKVMMDGIFGRNNFRNEIIWSYNSGPRGNNFGKRHDIILWYTATRNYIFNKDEVREPYSPNINIPKSKAHYYHPLGKVMGDVWEIPILGQNDKKERVGYPTQKPRFLLDRIIKASCPPDGIVLDPFCGSGTTLQAAELLWRRWIGIDIGDEAIQTSLKRMGAA